MTHSLVVVDGVAVGTYLEIPDSGLLVGRSTQTSGQLGGDPALSRHHARVTPKSSGGLLIEDLGSTNGTYVNGVRIWEPHTLHPGDIVEVGETTLRVSADSATAEQFRAASPTTSGSGSAAVGGNVWADRGSVGAVGEVRGDLDVSRQTVWAGGAAHAAGRDLHHSEHHEYDGTLFGFLSRSRGVARVFLALGVFLALAGIALAGFRIVQRETNPGPTTAEREAVYQTCLNPQRSAESQAQPTQKCVRAAAELIDKYHVSLNPWVPLGALAIVAGTAMVSVGVFLVRR